MATAEHAPPIRFQLNWRLQGPNAPFLLAARRGYFADAGLDVRIEPGEGSSVVTERVADGAFDAGFGDFNALIELAARRPDHGAVCVYMVYSRSPLAIVSRRAAGIRGPSDLLGRTLCGPPFDTGYRMFPALLRAAGLPPDGVRLLPVPPAERDRRLIAGEVDGVTGFDSTIVFALRAAGQDPRDYALLYYADAGVDVYTSAIVAARGFAAARPDALRALVGAINRGWRDAIARPDDAIDALVAADPALDRALAHEHLSWVIERQIRTAETAAIGLGAAAPERVERNLDIAAACFGLPRRPSAGALFDGRFLPPPAERRLPA